MIEMTGFETPVFPGKTSARSVIRSPSRAVLVSVAGAVVMLCASAALADDDLAPPPAPLPPSYHVTPLSPLAPPPSPAAPAAPEPSAPAAAPATASPTANPAPPAASPAPDTPKPEAPRSEAAAPVPDAAALDAPEATEPAASEPLEGPLRPKDDPAVAATAPAGHEESWNRTFDGGVRWKKGDTAVILSGTPGSGVRIGGSIAR